MSQFVATPGQYWEDLIGDRSALPVYQIWADLDDNGSYETEWTDYLDGPTAISGGGKLEGATQEAVSNVWTFTLDNTTLAYSAGDYAHIPVQIKAGFHISDADDVVTIFTGFVDERGARRVRGRKADDKVTFKCVDQLGRAAKMTMGGYFLVGMKICDPADTANSIFHFLADKAGFDEYEVDCGTISDVKDFVEIKDKAKPVKELQALAAAYTGMLRVNEAGILVFESRFQSGFSEPGYEWQIGPGDSDHPAIHRFNELGSKVLANRVRLEFVDYEELPATVGAYRVVYKNTKNYDTTTGEISIEVAAGDYFPGPGQYDVLACRYKDPDSGEPLVAQSVQTPTIGADATYDIYCSGGLMTLESFNGSDSDTRIDKDGSQMILRNNTGGTITIKRLTLRAVGYRTAAKVKCEALDASINDEWKIVDKKIDGKYVPEVTVGMRTCEYWMEYGRSQRQEYEVVTDWLPQVQEGAIIRLWVSSATYVDCQVLEYKHTVDALGMRSAATTLKLRQWYEFTTTNQGTSIVDDETDPSTGTTPEIIATVPTYEEINDGFTNPAGTGGTVTPTQPTISVEGTYKGFLVRWDRQSNLTNLLRYEVQVSSDNSTWYALEFDGSDWKTGVGGGDTDWFVELLAHFPLPFGGTEDAPTALTLYYRVRRITKLSAVSDWSTSASATNLLIETGDLAANTITAGKIETAALQALFAKVSYALTIGFGGTGTEAAPDDGDRRVYIDDDELKFQEANDNAEWENRASIARRVGAHVFDMLLSGFFKAGESVLSSWGRIWAELDSGALTSANGIAFDGTTVVVGGSDAANYGFVASTDQGETFGSIVTPAGLTLVTDMDSPDTGVFISVGASGKLYRSADSGASWSSIDSKFGTSSILNITHGDGKMVTVGADGKIAYSSDDGASWTLLGSTPLGTGQLRGVTFGNGTFVIVGLSGKIGTAASSDLTTWTDRANDFGGDSIYGIAYANEASVFVAVGTGGKTSRSLDSGATWETTVLTGGGVTLNDILAQDLVVVSSDGDGTVWRSGDAGQSWADVGEISTFSLDACVAEDRMFMLVGSGPPCIFVSDYLEAGAGIVEQGKHATNGSYVVHSNGRIECEVVIANAAGAAKTWTFPKPFTDASSIVVTGSQRFAVTANLLISFAPPTTTIVSFGALVANTGAYYGAAQNCSLRATGV